MNPHQWQRSILAIWPRDGRRRKAGARRRRPVLEPMESRQLLSTIAAFPTPTATASPTNITAGPDGNLWFTEFVGNKIGSINPATHAISEFTPPTTPSEPLGIAAGPDGNLWFTEAAGNKIGSINPTTHAIVETALPTAGATPYEIAAGPDGNLWFTESNGNKIGTINPTTRVISEFTIPTANSQPLGITAGPDGNLWFAEYNTNKVGMINPATHAIAEFTIPTASSNPYGIAAGPDGNLWFTEQSGNKIGSINPTTGAITESATPTPNSAPRGIAAGPDGNLWFTEVGANQVGSINPITRGIVETAIPTAASLPAGIAAGPDGNLWFAESMASNVAVLTPTLVLAATPEPPALIPPNAPFGLTVAVNYLSGLPDTSFNGNVTLVLATNPGGATLGGTTTAAVHNGVASFSGLTLDQVGKGYRIMAYTDPLTTTLTGPVTVAVPPTIVAEKVLLAGKGRRKHVVGYELDFSTAMDPTRAAGAAEYTLTQLQRRGGQLVGSPVALQAAYDAAAHSVTLTLAGKPKFARGGKLVVVGASPGGLTDAAGVPLDGGNLGVLGDDGTFVIGRKGNTISR